MRRDNHPDAGGHGLQFHHIFPKAFLKTAYSPREADDIANYAFIGGKTNRSISDKPPSDYLAQLVDKIGKSPFESQCIPISEELLPLDRYSAFLAERRKRISERLNTFLDTNNRLP